ncbi:RNA-guided endonuclease InsQ/TnpB family protein [Candidatus Entotheonella palauensis]|uniref:RNA-guided endonuclease InsQ/TnpB family protein n=1 Tax=Candidatus Entotheonella palauensis TaxID=93172 RepID=UPI000B7EA766|nr:RNA-guided endonuclease TnpB family protein [Candidatus Entotheonella palauensis]
MQKKTLRYRLYPTGNQTQALDHQLGEACRLYNAALQERRDAYQYAGISLSYYDQANQLKEIRALNGCDLANFSCSQDVLRRVDKTFKAFFARVQRGETPGYPRFKSRFRYDSITFPSYGDGARLRPNGKLYIQGVGEIKVKLHRPIACRIKTVTVKREAGRWSACFCVETAGAPDTRMYEDIGIDMGLESFAVLSDGTVIDNPRWYRQAHAKLRVAQRRVARRKRGSKGRRKAVELLQRAHEQVRNTRRDFHHKVARELVERYSVIFVENLNIKGLARGRLAKSVTDAGWGGFLQILRDKAAEAGCVVWSVNPCGTSQTCTCGAPVPKTLSQRWHKCLACGLSLARDHVSALLIQGLGRSLVS